MGQQPEAPPAFCACPPSCLALLGDEKVDLEKVEKVFFDEARQLHGRLKEQLSQVWTELGLFLKLMYKNKNQHRRSLYYRRLSEVRRDLQMLSTSGLDATVESFAKFFTARRSAATQSKLKDAIDERKALCTLLGVARLLNQTDGPIMAGSVQLVGLLGQSFFMPFALTMFACLARFRVLLAQVHYEVVTAFNLLSAGCQKNKKVSVSGLPIQLECQWDGAKLCMTEKKPASTQESKETESKILAEPAPLWCVDDRTGVKYDLGVLAAVAGSGGEELNSNLQATLNVSKGTPVMVHDVERMTSSIWSDLEKVSPNLSRLDAKEDSATPSGADFISDIDTSDQVKHSSVSTLVSVMPAMPAAFCSGVAAKAERRESTHQEPDNSTRLRNYQQDSRTGSAMEKSVAYISIKHKIPLDSTTRGTMVQNAQRFDRGDGVDPVIKQEVKDRDVKGFGSEDDMRHSVETETQSVRETGLSIDDGNTMPTILPVSFSSSSTEMVESGPSKKELEKINLHQEIADAHVLPHPDDYVRDDPAACIFRPLEADTGPLAVPIEGALQCTITRSSNAVDSSTTLVKDIDLKMPFSNPELNSGWKEDRPETGDEDDQETGRYHVPNLPMTNLEEAGEQNATTLTPSKSPRKESGVKRPVAYVSVGYGVRTPQKKRKEDGQKIARVKGNIDTDRKQPPIGLGDRPTQSEANSVNASSKESESKKKKTNDIFAMLLGGFD